MANDSKRQRMVAPQWLKNLPAGTYTALELEEITGLTSTGLTRTMRKYGEVEIIKIPAYRNLSSNIYKWSGRMKKQYQ
jgi:hypothetical protein